MTNKELDLREKKCDIKGKNRKKEKNYYLIVDNEWTWKIHEKKKKWSERVKRRGKQWTKIFLPDSENKKGRGRYIDILRAKIGKKEEKRKKSYLKKDEKMKTKNKKEKTKNSIYKKKIKVNSMLGKEKICYIKMKRSEKEAWISPPIKEGKKFNKQEEFR